MDGFKCRCSDHDKDGCMHNKDACFCLENFFMHTLEKRRRTSNEKERRATNGKILRYRTCALDVHLTTGVVNKVAEEVMRRNLNMCFRVDVDDNEDEL